MKKLLLAASLLALGGCVAPGYYVQPDYAGGGYYDSAGGYYSGGYYGDGGGYYPDEYDGGCCSAGVSIGYGYGYPGYYGWSGYPYGYYGGGYYGHRGRHHSGGDWDDPHGGHDGHDHHWNGNGHGDDHHDDHWHGDHMDGAVQRWPSAQRWNNPDRASAPQRDEMAASSWSTPHSEMTFRTPTPQVAPRIQSRSESATGRTPAPARSWTPHRADTSSKKEF